MAGRTGSKYWPYEVQLVKTDASGEIQWQQDFNFLSNAAGLVQASDGGYVIAGDSYNASESGPMTYPAPRGVMLVKTDQNGTMQWNQTLTGPSDGSASMIQTSDGGYLIIGNIKSHYLTFDSTSFMVTSNGFLIKTDGWGNVQWNQTYGEPHNYSAFNSVTQTNDGYAIAGSTNFNGKSDQYLHLWLVKVDLNGGFLWSKTFGQGAGDNQGKCILQTADNSLLLAGDTATQKPGSLDVWLIKTDADGNVLWDYTYGGSGTFTVHTVVRDFTMGSNDNGVVNSLIQTSDGGFAFAGASAQMWLVKIGSSGIVQWNQTYPKSPPDPIWVANSLIETSDGGFALAGDYFIPSTEGLYVLIKTEPALPPPPTPSPIPTPGPSPTPTSALLGIDYTWLAVAAVVVVLIAVVAGVLLRRHRKQS